VHRVDVDQNRHGNGDDDARHQVDVEQPVPGRNVGNPATDDRAQRGGQRGDGANGRRGNDPLFAGEKHERRGEHHRDHRTAQKPLQRPKRDHALDIPGQTAQQAGE
nr:hypothetical protein [Tanacetum cinerariifolium]